MLGMVEQRKAANLKLGMAVQALQADGKCQDRVIRAYKHLVFIDPSIFGVMDKDFARLVSTMTRAIQSYTHGNESALAHSICDSLSEDLWMFVWNLSGFEREQYGTRETSETLED